MFGIEAYKSIRTLPRGFLRNQKVFIYNTKFWVCASILRFQFENGKYFNVTVSRLVDPFSIQDSAIGKKVVISRESPLLLATRIKSAKMYSYHNESSIHVLWSRNKTIFIFKQNILLSKSQKLCIWHFYSAYKTRFPEGGHPPSGGVLRMDFPWRHGCKNAQKLLPLQNFQIVFSNFNKIPTIRCF